MERPVIPFDLVLDVAPGEQVPVEIRYRTPMETALYVIVAIISVCIIVTPGSGNLVGGQFGCLFDTLAIISQLIRVGVAEPAGGRRRRHRKP